MTLSMRLWRRAGRCRPYPEGPCLQAQAPVSDV
uniref:Uncharacterized protein n=1 Tax=Anguilla anguilla TaxID=7936 RepID=A0A0E9UQ26_ANGAN